MNGRLRVKTLLAVGATFLAGALSFVAADPVTYGYELSVYDAYPFPFWALVVGSLFLGQLVVFESLELRKQHRYWKAGLVLLLATNAVLLFLPVVRYHLYTRGDMLTFIGMINQIGELGIVPRSNYYPNLHLLTLTISYVTGLDVRLLVNLVPPVISLFYVLALYALLNDLFEHRGKLLFVLPIASLLLFTLENLMFTPSVFGFMLLPLVLFVMTRIYAGAFHTRFRLLFVLVVVSIVFYHPLTTLFLIGVFLMLKATFVVGRRATGVQVSNTSTGVVAASIAFVIFFSWYYSFDSIVGSTTIVLYYLFGAIEGSTTYGQITSVASRTSPQLVDMLLVGIFRYGLVAPIISLSSVLVGYLGYLFARDRLEYDVVTAFLSAVLFVFTFGSIVTFFIDFPFGTTRPLRYVRFAGSILIGLGMYTLYRRIDARAFRRYLRPMIYVTFFVFAYFSVFMLYGSPMINEENNQITTSEINGMEWLLTHRDHSMLIDELGISQYRVYSYLYETNVPAENIRRQQYGTRAPAHFAYNNTTLIGGPRPLGSKRYLVITQLGRMQNPRFFPGYRRFWRHTPADFERLKRDPTFAHIYDNGELDGYVVYGLGNETAAPN